MVTKLTGAYRTADGRFFERDDRDVARAHDAWLELVAWTYARLPVGDEISREEVAELVCEMATDPALLAILKRKPAEAPPRE